MPAQLGQPPRVPGAPAPQVGAMGQGALVSNPLLGQIGRAFGQNDVAGTNKPEHMKGTLGGKGLPFANELLGPQAITDTTQQLFQLMQSSPAFAAMLKSIMGQGQQFNTGVQSALGRTGLSGTGVGAVTGALANSATSNALTQARGQLFSDALQTALQSLMARGDLALGAAGHYAGRTGEGFKARSLMPSSVGVGPLRMGLGGN